MNDLDRVTETSMEPVDLSDFTIHFKDHSYHVHSQILSGASKYFRAAISAAKSGDATECSLTKQCVEAGHRCVVLPEQLGGSNVSISELTKFLDVLYHPDKVFTSDQRDPAFVFPRASFMLGGVGAVGTKFVLDGDNLSTTLPGGASGTIKPGRSMFGIMNFTSTVTPCSRDLLEEFLNNYEQSIELAIYFDCQRLLQAFMNRCQTVFDYATYMKHFDSLWKLLPLVDTYQWNFLPQLLEALVSDTGKQSRKAKQDTLAAYNNGRGHVTTLTTLLSLCL